MPRLTKEEKKIAVRNRNINANILSEFKKLKEEYEKLLGPNETAIKQQHKRHISRPLDKIQRSDGMFYVG